MENVIFSSKNSPIWRNIQTKFLPLRLAGELSTDLYCSVNEAAKPNNHNWLAKAVQNCLVLLLLSLCAQQSTYAQTSVEADHVKWSFSAEEKGGGKYKLNFNAQMDKGWHIYLQDCPSEDSRTTFYVDPNNKAKYLSNIEEKGVLTSKLYDRLLYVYKDNVMFELEVQPEQTGVINGQIKYLVCNDVSCLGLRYVNFEFKF